MQSMHHFLTLMNASGHPFMVSAIAMVTARQTWRHGVHHVWWD